MTFDVSISKCAVIFTRQSVKSGVQLRSYLVLILPRQVTEVCSGWKMNETTLLDMFSYSNKFISFCALTRRIQPFFFQGGEADVNTVGKMILNDFQRGKLPYFVAPPSKVKKVFKNPE